MKALLPLSLSLLSLLSTLVAPLLLSSCASKSGGSGDGTYTPPPTLSPADATERMRSEYREWIR